MIRLDRNAQYITLFTLLRKSEGRRRAKNRQGKSRRARGYSVASVSLSRSLRLPFAIYRHRGRKRKPRGQRGAYIYCIPSVFLSRSDSPPFGFNSCRLVFNTFSGTRGSCIPASGSHCSQSVCTASLARTMKSLDDAQISIVSSPWTTIRL